MIDMEKVQRQHHACTACGEHGHNRRCCPTITNLPTVDAKGRDLVKLREWARRNYQANREKRAAVERERYRAKADDEAFVSSRRDRANKWYASTPAAQDRGKEKNRLRYAKMNPDAGKLRAKRNEPGAREERQRRHRERKSAWRAINPEKMIEYTRRYVALHPARRRESFLRWKNANPEKFAEAQRRWVAANPDKIREKNLLRDYRSATASGRATAAQIRARVEYFGGVCSYCGGTFEHMDHSIALARGGTNWPANLRPACEGCNLSKCAKPIRQFMLERGYVVAPLPLP